MWPMLTKLFLLVLSAYAAGILAQHFRQSAIVGYLLAGSLVGGFLFDYATVASVAELGVALLLFSIGLEFSFRQLKALGSALLIGGTLQVTVTLAVVAGLLAVFMPTGQAVVIGCAFTVSSTAIVLRVLLDTAQMDASRGRMALGVLLIQDLAVVPLVLVVSLMGDAGPVSAVMLRVAKTAAAAGGLVLVFYLLFHQAIPWLLRREGLFANRELMILLAILSAMGAIGGAHMVGLSPALGAFLAGMLLAESPFATQIRADIDAIRTLFVVLFFTSIGMLLDLAWLVAHIHLVLPVVLLVFVAKAGIIVAIFRMLGIDSRVALATGITLGQAGEFAFVLVSAGRAGGLVSADVFTGVVSVTMLSMFLAPYMVAYADPLARRVLAAFFRRPMATPLPAGDAECKTALVVGFGPAGRTVAEKLKAAGVVPDVIELNPAAREAADRLGVVLHLGDATRPEVLAHAGIHDAGVVVVTVPDSRTAADMIRTIRTRMPSVPVIARGRYHRHIPMLVEAGASMVVDEEEIVGARLADITAERLAENGIRAMACRMIGQSPTAGGRAADPQPDGDHPAGEAAPG
jgi:monovalent cation:H+ antiporter-2, CPA2 family